ncbi:MAG: hypothetical protein ABIH09_02630 [Candidatus Omnitrophota bacterium]
MKQKNIKLFSFNVIITAVLLSVCFHNQAFASETITMQKENIRRLYNEALFSYSALNDKIEIVEQTEYLKNIVKEMNDYLELARKLEKQEKYQQAIKCYNEILILSQDPEVKSFISSRNKKLKQLAQKTQKSVSKKISKQKAAILNARKPTRSSKIENLDKQHDRRTQLLSELQQRLNQLEQEQQEQKE